jgi:drug/metabolite transporter (DMT)-like permease
VRISGYGLVALAALLFAANGPVSIVLIEDGVSARYVVTGRLAGMAGVLLTWAVLRFREHLRLPWPALLELAAFGVAGLAFMQWTYAEAISRMDIGLVLMIEYMSPFLIALWSYLLWRHRQHRSVWVSTGIALAGLVLVLDVGGGTFANLSGPGLAFAVITMLIFSYYATHASRLLRDRPPQVVLGVAGLVAVLVWSVTLAPIWHYPLHVVTSQIPLGGNIGGTVPGWCLVLYSATLGSAVPFVLFLAGVARIGPTRSAITLMLESVAAIAFAWGWLEQRLTMTQLLGGATVVAAVILLQLARQPDGAALVTPAAEE